MTLDYDSHRPPLQSGSRDSHPAVGDLVQSILGESVGRVTNVSYPVFDISMPTGQVRLPFDSVFTRTHQLITLICDRPGLVRYQIPVGRTRAG